MNKNVLGNKWVGTWGTSTYLAESDNMPPVSLSNSTLRQIIRVSIGGSKIRLKFSNRLGNSPLTMNSVHLAVSTGESLIDINKDVKITFGGSDSVTIQSGQDINSDTIDYYLPELSNMAITIYFGNVPHELTGHPGSRTVSYIKSGNAVIDSNMSLSTIVEHWYVIRGIDVLTQDFCSSLVCFGDSITDGRGTTTNAQNRWTDKLADRLIENSYKVGVVNQGIGATLASDSGIERFERDVLEQTGIRYLIVLYGINDILFDGADANRLVKAYKVYINKAHNNGVITYGGTILPCGGYNLYNSKCERVRQEVNEWIRTTNVFNGGFNGVIDFDAALRDGINKPIKLKSIYDSGDALHPGPMGYQAIADAVDLSLFRNN